MQNNSTKQFDKYFITPNFVYYTAERQFHLMCFSGLWESEVKLHWNQRINTKILLPILAAPLVGGKETTPRATNFNPAVPDVTQRFQWLKQYIRSKGSEKSRLGLGAQCLLHIQIRSQHRVQDVQIINHSFGFEFMVLEYIMILQGQHQLTKQLYLVQW